MESQIKSAQRTSQNIVFTGVNQVGVLPEPVLPLEPDTVLIESNCSLVSTGTEGIMLACNFSPGTHWANWVKFPMYPGYSLAGQVLEVGPDVTRFKPGDRVAARAWHHEYSSAPEDSVYPIPDALPDEDAAWVALGSIVQHGVRKARIEMGETVVIIGLGLLGQLAVQYARVAGAGEIIAIDTAPKRLEMAAMHGATHTLLMSAQEALAAVEEITGGAMADVVFDVTGHPAAFAGALKLPRRFGRVVLLGDAGKPDAQCLTADVVTRDLQILGAHDSSPPTESSIYAPWSKAKMVEIFFRFLERGQMRVSNLVTHHYASADAAAAYEMLQTRRDEAMGVIFHYKNRGH